MKEKWITLMLTSQCNSFCKHCYINFHGSMSFDEAYQIKNNLSSKFFVEVNGAELLTNVQYVKLFATCGRDSIMTNGKALIKNKSLLPYLRKHGVSTISLSYHYGVHDDMCDVKASQLDKLIEEIKDQFKINVMVTLNIDNFHLLDEMCEYFLKSNVHSIIFTNYLCQGKNKFPEKILNEDQIQWVLDKICELRKNYSKDQLIIKRSGSFGKDKKRQCRFECSAGIDDFVLTPNMNVYPCIFLCEERFCVGKYVNGDIVFFDNQEVIHPTDECLALKKLNHI